MGRYRGFVYRIYPTAEQMKRIDEWLGCCRLVYNLALETKIYAYKAHGINLSVNDLINQLPKLKKEFPFLKDVYSHALQAAIVNIGTAYDKFFKHGGGFPKFKRRGKNDSFRCPDGRKEIDFPKGLLSIPKITDIKIAVDRKFKGKINNITIRKRPSGKYFASILVETDEMEPPKKPINKSVGIDMGLTTFATLSDGTTIGNPRHFRRAQERLALAQFKYSRTKKGSKNREKQKNKVTREHEYIANCRKDYLHKASDAITKRFDTICIEDLNISGMSKKAKPKLNENGKYLPNGQSAKSGLNKSILDAGWGMFANMLEYKSRWRGNNFIKVDRFFPSSKMCNCCKTVNKDLKLSDRTWKCSNCGTEHHRDPLASINIEQEGVRLLKELKSGWVTSKEPVGDKKVRRRKSSANKCASDNMMAAGRHNTGSTPI